jgi:hypothetical protein
MGVGVDSTCEQGSYNLGQDGPEVWLERLSKKLA